MIINVLDEPFRDKLNYVSAKLVKRQQCLSNDYLDETVEIVLLPKVLIINGVQLRPNSIVALKNQSCTLFPTFGVICELVVVDEQIYILIRNCHTTWYNEFFQAYEIDVTDNHALVCVENCFLHTTYSFWSSPTDTKKYISRRFYNQDY